MAKKSAPGTVTVDESFEPKMDGEMVEEMLGFPPYWEPADEKNAKGHYGSFFATVVGFDDSDEEFERWVFQAKHKTLCHKGPADDQEEVIIEAGEFFSVSNYAQLRLSQYMGLDIKLTVEDKVDVKKGKMWVWKLETTKETHALLMQRRQGTVNAAMAKSAEAAAS
jgi:hypothetical protein